MLWHGSGWEYFPPLHDSIALFSYRRDNQGTLTTTTDDAGKSTSEDAVLSLEDTSVTGEDEGSDVDMDIDSNSIVHENDFDYDDGDEEEDEDEDTVIHKRKQHCAPLYIVKCQTCSDGIYSSNVTKSEHELAVLAFAARHNLSDTALEDLLLLLKLYLPESNLLDSSVPLLKERCGFHRESLNSFTFCNT